ncbi:uncharacterized protein LY79DRAFT_335016 [Colletotrichum navitas]|uniref:Uncharacterized protein n=1 Tax=Colletotrichum navitas TaxID=681940 RepID=A0AAD8PTJ6_9PEZI|nr:uncharacterized protein LY79DRAFT_335016 [Colletotrichum navitas]KAK1579778.1 hypothetical protein LY79DRAFT_335016 [Colletotrichum navitas]
MPKGKVSRTADYVCQWPTVAIATMILVPAESLLQVDGFLGVGFRSIRMTRQLVKLRHGFRRGGSLDTGRAYRMYAHHLVTRMKHEWIKLVMFSPSWEPTLYIVMRTGMAMARRRRKYHYVGTREFALPNLACNALTSRNEESSAIGCAKVSTVAATEAGSRRSGSESPRIRMSNVGAARPRKSPWCLGNIHLAMDVRRSATHVVDRAIVPQCSERCSDTMTRPTVLVMIGRAQNPLFMQGCMAGLVGFGVSASWQDGEAESPRQMRLANLDANGVQCG